ncbi:MAG: hypothetical protein CMJ83_12935 [Planctomycetes bacterium]|nr:hypothetical protein [Planctomycetota bacterium]
MPDTTTFTSRELFDPEFLDSLTRLHILARRVARSGRPAEQRSRDMGSGVEFRDFRAYSAGDDFKSIDWTVYRRLGKVFLRLYEELEDLPVYLLLDRSRSLFEEETPRIRGGLRCALALAAISLQQHDSVGLFPFAGRLETALRPRSGKSRLFRFAETLAAMAPEDSTDFAKALQTFSGLRLRRGLCVIISDFFDPAGIDRVVKALKTVRHRLLLVRLWRRTDQEPDLGGDFQLVDCETGTTEDVSATAAVMEAYRASYRRFDEGLTSFARERGAGMLLLDTDREVVPQLATLFETGSYTV